MDSLSSTRTSEETDDNDKDSKKPNNRTDDWLHPNTILEEDEFDEDDADLDIDIILRRDPNTKRRIINKSAYVKLHRATSPNRNTTNVLKEIYEKPDEEDKTKLDNFTVEYLKNKYSPANYNKVHPEVVRPTPKPRLSLKSETGSASSDKNERRSSSSSAEFIPIVIRSESEASIDKVGRELDLFVMDESVKDKKKRSNSFKRIFSGKIFGRSKKVDEQIKEQPKLPCKENVVYSDNMKNETNAFNRQVPYRHTYGGSSRTQKEIKLYRNDSQKSVIQKPNYNSNQGQFHSQTHNKECQFYKRDTENRIPSQNYVNKPVTGNNYGQISYARTDKSIETSSSSSTLDSDRNREVKQYTLPREMESRNYNSYTRNNRKESQNNPWISQQDMQLINPKASIPIHSKQLLPHYYDQNKESVIRNQRANSQPNIVRNEKEIPPPPPPFQDRNKPYLEDTYGVVFDSLDHPRRGVTRNPSYRSNAYHQESAKPPRSPSLELTKLKLPPNREIVPLSPRMRSPIPQNRISTDKIIATELLKPPRSPLRNANSVTDGINRNNSERSSVTPTRSLQRVSNTPDPDGVSDQESVRRSVVSPALHSDPEVVLRHRNSLNSPIPDGQEKIITNAVVHTHSPRLRTHVNQQRAASPQSVRSATPVDMRSPSSSKSQSPQKDDIRRSIEAYYWKEIKKLKEQENMDLYYQMQRIPYSYVDYPMVDTRRSRSISPNTYRNTRRSLSLPRDPKPPPEVRLDVYGRVERMPGRQMLSNQQPPEQIYYQNQNSVPQNFQRNVPHRQTIDAVPRSFEQHNTNSLYKPIFKRGSLTAPIREFEDKHNKNVSFSGPRVNNQQNIQYGYAKGPPTQNNNNFKEQIYLQNVPPQNNLPTSKLIIDGKEVYGYVNKPDLQRQSVDYYNKGQNNYDYSNNVSYQAEPSYGPLVVANRPTNVQEAPYGPLVVVNSRTNQVNRQELYDRPVGTRPVVNLARRDSFHGQRPPPAPLTRKMSYDNVHVSRIIQNGQQVPTNPPSFGVQRREIILRDEIFGQFGDYLPPESPRYISAPAPPRQSNYGYGSIADPKQVSVRNKVCDIYGQIHDQDQNENAAQTYQKGVMLGQLQRSPPPAQMPPQVTNENFVRNSRLTASANDMYKRYENVDPRYRSDVIYQSRRAHQNGLNVPSDGTQRRLYQSSDQNRARGLSPEGAPTRPLPPVPTNKKSPSENRDLPDGSATNEKQKSKKKKRSFFWH